MEEINRKGSKRIKKDQGWENIEAITLTSPIETKQWRNICSCFKPLKMYSLIIVDISKNAYVPNIHVPLQITNIVTQR